MEANQEANEAIDTGLGAFAAEMPAQEQPQPEAPPEPPSPPINFAEPEPPRVLTLEQALALQQAQAAQEAPQPEPQPQPQPRQQMPSAADVQIDDGIGIVEQRDGSVMLKTTPAPVVNNRDQFVPDKLRSKTDAELEAGRLAVAKHEAAYARRPKPQPTEAEIRAQGTNTPVFRPGDFREYRGTMQQVGQTVSKDNGRNQAAADAKSLDQAGY